MLAYLSNWASIVSLVLTFVNTYLIQKIRAGIVIHLTLEPMLARLSDNSAELNQHLAYYETGGQEFLAAAGICEANAKAIRRRLGYVKGRFVVDLLRAMRAFKRERSRANAQEVYVCLQQVRQHVANLIEEKRITG